MRFPLPKYYPASLFQAIHQGPIQFTTLPILQIPPGTLCLTSSLTQCTDLAKINHQDLIVIAFLESQWNPCSKLTLRCQLFLNATEQTQLFNYLHSNINFSRNERLNAHTALQKCMLLGCSNTLHSTAAMCHSLHMAPCSLQMARNTTCHSYWLLSIIKMRWRLLEQIWVKEATIFQWVYILCFICTFTFWTLWREEEQSEEKRQTYIAFDCIRHYIQYVLSIC